VLKIQTILSEDPYQKKAESGNSLKKIEKLRKELMKCSML
jgi:hypothetical protein